MPKARGLAHRARDLTLEELSRHFHLPINEVARELGLCVTVLKQRCREHGITRWPYRKVRKLDNLISALETNASSASLDGMAVTATPGELQMCLSGDDEVMKKLDAVKETRNFLLMNPNSTAHLRIGKVKGPQSRSGKRSPADSGSPSPGTSSPSISPPHCASRQFAEQQQMHHQQQQHQQEREQPPERILNPPKKAPAAASCMADTGSKPQAASSAHIHSQQHTHPTLLRWSENESVRGREAATPPAGRFADMEAQKKVGLSSWVVSGGLSSDPRQSAFRPLARQPSRTASSSSEADNSNGVGTTLRAAAAAVAPLGASVRTGGLSSSMSSRESAEEEVGGGGGMDGGCPDHHMGPALLRRVPSMDASSSGLTAGAGGGAGSEASAAVSACSSPSPQQREHTTAGTMTGAMVHMHHPPAVARPMVAIPQQPFAGAQFGMQWVPSAAVVYGGGPPMLLPPGAPSPPMTAAYGLSPHFSPMGWYEFPMCIPWVTPTSGSGPRFAFPGDEGGWKSPMTNPDMMQPHFGAYEQRSAGGGACAK